MQEDQSAQIQFIYLICGKRIVLRLLTAAENIAMQKRIYVVPAPKSLCLESLDAIRGAGFFALLW